LVIAASLIAALSVEPFLYAAIMIEIAALACVPILAPPGKPVPTGVTRFLTFMTLGMAVILLSGWMLELVEANPADAGLLLRTSVVIALGLMFFMAIFPFHTWIPMVSDESPPYTSAYVFFVLLAITSVLALSFLVRFPWMRSAFFVFSTLRFLGALMVLMGGIWAAFQRHLGRMFGYAVVYEIGLTLLALSLGERGFNLAIKTSAGPAPFNATAVEIFFALLLPRGLSLALWAVALTVLRARFGGLTFRQVQGAARQLPIASASLVLAHLSLAGFPLLAAFPVRVALWTGLAERNLAVVGIVLFGTAGLMAGALRTLAVLVMGATEEGWQVHETWGQMLLMGIATVMLFVIGFLPQYFLPSISSLALLMSP
jgi:formate hydrogenlyase subunit 3/multisubunit Na+/H+ antiporter MnhD subunit